MLIELMLATILHPECQIWTEPVLRDGFCLAGASYIGALDGASYGLAKYCDAKRCKYVLETQPSSNNGQADWKVIDELYAPEMTDKQLWIQSAGFCRLNGKDDPEIFAMVSLAHQTLYVPAVKAWRADRKRGKIIPIPARGVDCEVERCE